MLLYYEPCARITVGNVVFNNVNEVYILESVVEMGDKATVTLPRNYKELKGKGVLEYLKVGQSVAIELGTGLKYYPEFTGYLSKIESGSPLVLHFDDEFWPLKRNSWLKSWPEVTLKALLAYIAPGYTITAPDVNLGAFQISNASSYRVLMALVEQYGFYSYIRGEELVCQFAYDVRGYGQEHNYVIGRNVKHSNDLKYARAEDVKIKIVAIANKRDGKKIKKEVGSTDKDASVRTLNFGDVSADELELAAEKMHSKLSFDGYTGTITGFAFPRTHAGDTLNVTDLENPERDGSYLIEKVEIKYNLSTGFERVNTLSFRVDSPGVTANTMRP
jgi:hypothetical protein